MKRHLATALGLAATSFGISCDRSAPAPADEIVAGATAAFVGSWRLDSWTTADGRPRCGDEEGPARGQITYTSDGHMSAQLGCVGVDLAPGGTGGVDGAAARLIRRHFSYYGRYTVDQATGVVTHHVEGSVSEGWVGTDRPRSYAFLDDGGLELTVPDGGNRLVWRRNR